MNANNIDPHIKEKIEEILTFIKERDDKYKETLKKYIEHQLMQIITEKVKKVKNNNWKTIKNTLKYSIHEVIDTVTTAIIDMVRTGQIDKEQVAIKAGLKISAVIAKALCEVGGRCWRSRPNTPRNNGRNFAVTIKGGYKNNKTRRRKV